ncbi:MAG: PGPGW domain-containing protein [candidate division KSB1 bacterium]|nr:PGPGW domain-containing protein [candidate division KSB1 bacterium]
MESMTELGRFLFEFMRAHKVLLLGLMVFSIVAFFGTLASVPLLLIHLPADYFSAKRRKRRNTKRHPAIRMLLILLKNLIGWVVILAGIAMLVLPGQGILTIIAGLMLINFPGKYGLERRLISRPPVIKAVNELRAKAGKPPLIIESEK